MTRSLLFVVTAFEVVVVTLLLLTLFTGLSRRVHARNRAHLRAEARTALVFALGAPSDRAEAAAVGALQRLTLREATDVIVGVAANVADAERVHLAALAEEMGVVARAVHKLRSTFVRQRLGALRVFAALQVASPRVTALLDDSHPEVRASAAWAWHQSHRGDDATRIITPLAADADGRVQHVVAEIIAARGSNGCAIALDLLGGGTTTARRCALLAATRLSDPELTAAVVTATRNDDPMVRVLAVRALRGRSGPETGAALTAMLDDPDARVRSAAVAVLASVVGDRAIALLGPRTNDSDPRVRFAAASSLLRLGPVGELVLSAGPNPGLLAGARGTPQ